MLERPWRIERRLEGLDGSLLDVPLYDGQFFALDVFEPPPRELIGPLNNAIALLAAMERWGMTNLLC